ncbi:unnamed protein product [Parascedosporium putredinis]|uniref:Dolichyl-diphosphooligosaccharide--protein glycosyltransferase subunit WBP1 n=1 Tax=Parascedosporium putredinis TaxID=1442378 RepID=A0A9P1GW69_9PEZI|nr:unnamed protein product [Parascedosporium putredinis]CAI7988145.1 unnamed protein product [Parascedosporium putredinis]
MKSFVAFLVLLLAAVVQAVSSAGSRLLVILDDVADNSEYSKFFDDLSKRGFKITYETPKSESLSLSILENEPLGPNLTPNILVDFMNADGNILVALSSSTTTSSSVTALLAELDISLPAERSGLVVDHFDYDTSSAADKHDVLLLSPPKTTRPGQQQYFTPETTVSELIAFPAVYNPKEETDAVDPQELFAVGEQLGLVSAFQGRNSARFTLVGAAEMLSDTWFDAKVKKTGGKAVGTWNREFAKRVSAWTFKEIGVLRVNSIEHRLNEPGVDAEPNPSIYRIKNDVTYTISVSEYSWDKWTAYLVPDGDELQLEFSMLSPFHRLNLSRAKITKDACTYSAAFKLPDQHGIYNFLVNYKRPFLSNVEEKTTVSVRHMAHDEWDRSFTITAAWPWISGIGATVVGFVAFSALFMYSKPTDRAVESKKKQ